MAAALPTVLVADDQPDVIAALRLLLRGAGFDTQGATSGAEGLDLISDIHATQMLVSSLQATVRDGDTLGANEILDRVFGDVHQ